MRTTIRLDDDLLRQASHAAATGRTLSALIEDALREVLGRRRERGSRPPIKLRTVGGTGTRPGVDLDDSSALSDLMDRT